MNPFGQGGLADSCFNMYVEIVVQTPNGPLVLHNKDPKRMCAVINHKPPGPGTVYESPERIPLYRPDGTFSGYYLCATRHLPSVEIDHFPQTAAIVELCTSNTTEKVIVQGPTTVAVDIGPNGETTLSSDGRDRVLTHMWPWT